MQNNCLVTHILVHHPHMRNEERLIKEISARRGAVVSGKGPGQALRVAWTERERARRRKCCRNSSALVPHCRCPRSKALLPCASFHAALELGYFQLVSFCRAPTATLPWVQFSFNNFKKANNPIFCKPPPILFPKYLQLAVVAAALWMLQLLGHSAAQHQGIFLWGAGSRPQ